MLAEYRSAQGNLAASSTMMRLALNHHRRDNGTEQGGPLSFLDMPFLVQIYRDMLTVRELVAQKCTQVGWTEAGMLYGVAQAGLRGRRHALVLPDADVARTFVQDRVQPLIERVPYYGELRRAGGRRKAADNVSLMHLGHGSWRFIGSNKPAKLREFPADSILVDEVDECNQANLPLVRDRVRNSEHPQLLWFGNPRLSERGISRMFQKTDQREWFHQCTHCNHRQRIDWFRNVVDRDDAGNYHPRDTERAGGLSKLIEVPARAQDIRPVCLRCGRPWERQREGCTWVAMHPGVARRGYHVSRMDHLGQRLWTLFLEFLNAGYDEDAIAAFFAGVLGIAHERPEGRLTMSDLQGATIDRPMDYQGGPDYKRQTVVMGVDVGAVLHCTISTVQHVPEDPSDRDSDTFLERTGVWVGSVKTFDDLWDLLERYHVDILAIDMLPELHKVQEFRDRVNYSSKVPTICWLVQYHPTDKVGVFPYGLKLKAEEFTIQVDKTQVMDATVRDIRQRRRTWPAGVELVLHWAEHMKTPVRQLVQTKRGERYVWDRGNKRDDYRQAECYERVAADLWAMSGGNFEVSLG